MDSESTRRYEDAVRAESQGKLDEAKQLAQQGLALSPNGPLAPSLKRLIDRIAQEQLERVDRDHLQLAAPQYAPRATPSGARASWVLSGAFAGITEGIVIAGATNADGKGVAGGGLAGVAFGLAVTLATMSEVSEPAVPAHLTLGWTYGLLAGFAIAGLAQPGSSSAVLAAGAIGLPVGALTGTLTGVYANVTEGDAAAADVLMVQGVAIPLLFAAAATPNLSSQTAFALGLTGGTIGLLAGELLNRDLAWSEGRWAVIGASGGLGALVGVLIAVAGGLSTDGALVAIAALDVLGLGIGIVATQSFPGEAPRGYHFPSGPAPTAQNALPPTQGPPGLAPKSLVAPLLTFEF